MHRFSSRFSSGFLPRRRFVRAGSAVLLVGLLLPGCALVGPGRERTERTRPEPVAEQPLDMARYEDFDPAPYEEAPIEPSVEVSHDVPAELMQGTVRESGMRTARGYRIQIFNTADKDAADNEVARIIEWWRAERTSGGGSDLFRSAMPPVYTVYRQPYYRIRLGNFATRAQAERALSAVSARFPGALIVPDTVTLQ